MPVVGPGNASLGSRSQDAAALYFYEDAGRGGQSGYLVATNATGGQFLQSSVSMTMLGYPVEGVGDTARGRLFNTPTTAYSFVLLTNGVFSTTTAAGLPGVLDETTRCRLNRAERLLRETRLPVQHIVSLAGFGTAEQMRLQFQTRHHRSPAAFRKSE